MCERREYGKETSSGRRESRLPERWTARWIEPAEEDPTQDAFRPAYHLAGEFSIAGRVESAVLYATAHGIYEAYLNGARVGDFELTPGFTAYRKRLQVHRFDVSELVRSGDNVLGAILSDGWWRGQTGIFRKTNSYGRSVGFLAQLHVELATGERLVMGTDESWRWTPSHILAADLICGEVHDLRKRVEGWCDPQGDRRGWRSVRVAEYGYAELCEPIGPPVKRVGELAAVSIEKRDDGSFVVDFGQNSKGWVRLSDLGPAGSEITLVHGEWLDTAGNVTQANVAAGGTWGSRRSLPFQTDKVTSAGDGSVFEPRHSTKGFRYVQVRGHPGPLAAQSITSIVVHSDLRRIGGFECSDERIDRLHSAADWSFRANACDIPTDCPTRERSGWTGDWQIFVEAAAFLYDVADFSAKWLRDLAADQLESGAVTNIVPDPAPDAPLLKEAQGAAGWGDAAVHVPWAIYLATGRTDLLEDQFDSMKRWVEFAARRAASGRHRSRIERSREPLPHERYIWDTGWHWGEWLEPGVDMDTLFPRLLKEDHGPVATAYLFRSAKELSMIAGILGDGESEERYRSLSRRVAEAWRREFIDADGRIHPRTQANLVRALAFGLVPDDLRHTTVGDLVEEIREAGNHLATGFLSTPFLLPVLADHGYTDVAYELLFQDTAPSWLYMIDRGATTVWEEWEALGPDGSVSQSLDHYSKGAVISFLHGYVAGLQPIEPGYRVFRVAPLPGGGIDWARAYHESPYGRIEVSWETAAEEASLEVEVPEGSVAEMTLPDGSTERLPAGHHKRRWRVERRGNQRNSGSSS